MKNNIKTILATLCLFMYSAGCHAQSMEEYYTELSPALPTRYSDKVEVLEIFWYGCPHCYAFEPYVRDWFRNKPDNVVFGTVPGILNQAWVPHARAYYTAIELGILENIHHKLFEAIHKDRQRLFTEQELKGFFLSQGIDPDEFSRIYRSEATTEKLRNAFELQRSARITGVPAVIINGKYLTGPTQAGSYENMIKVIEHLVEREGGS